MTRNDRIESVASGRLLVTRGPEMLHPGLKIGDPHPPVDVIDRVERFLPTVAFRARDFPIEQLTLCLHAHGWIWETACLFADRDDPHEMRTVTFLAGAGFDVTCRGLEDAIAAGLRRALNEAMQHEIDECLRIGGVRRWDPHDAVGQRPL